MRISFRFTSSVAPPETLCHMKRIVFSALLGFVLCAGCNDSGSASADSTLTFVHLNDSDRIDAVENGNRGGFGRVATIVNELKEEGRDV